MRVVIKPSTIRAAILRPSRMGELRRETAGARRTPTPVRWLFFSFVFVLPFEATNMGFMTGLISLPRLMAVVFFGVYALYYGPLSRERPLPNISFEMLWFLGYATVFMLNVFFVSEELLGEFIIRCFTLMQLLLLLWIMSGLFRDEKVRLGFLVSFSVASALLAVANTLRLPGFYKEFEGRVTFPGDNPNVMAMDMAFAMNTLIGLALSGVCRRSVSKLLLLFLTVPILAVLVASSSRGGLVAVMVGCMAYLLPYRRRAKWLI